MILRIVGLQSQNKARPGRNTGKPDPEDGGSRQEQRLVRCLACRRRPALSFWIWLPNLSSFLGMTGSCFLRRRDFDHLISPLKSIQGGRQSFKKRLGTGRERFGGRVVVVRGSSVVVK